MVYKIALTGGPCAGKTTALREIWLFLRKKGYNVVIVPETATELINGGITPSNVGQINFQRNLLELQLTKEKIFTNSAEQLGKDVVIVFDRGCLDGKAYLTDDEYYEILQNLNVNEDKLINFYDAVIFLDSAAMSNANIYSTSNNPARKETVNEARKINIRTQEVWKKHRLFTVIKSESDFEEKISKLLSVIENLVIKY
ncbi:MAG: ATP-binding protein [Clostridia bacterium]|nr:ATP-binding protein [Clostridia bacterium]